MENKQLLLNALLAKGMTQEEAEKYLNSLDMNSLPTIDSYIKKADQDPSLMSSRNCSDGKCYSAEINFKHCKKHLKK